MSGGWLRNAVADAGPAPAGLVLEPDSTTLLRAGLPTLLALGRITLELVREAGKVDLDYLAQWTNAACLVNEDPGAEHGLLLKNAERQPLVIDRRSDEIDSRETGVPAVITSRALASLTELCAMAAPFFGPETRAVFHKGREHVDELTESGAIWHHDVITIRSDTDPQGVLLELKNLRLRHR